MFHPLTSWSIDTSDLSIVKLRRKLRDSDFIKFSTINLPLCGIKNVSERLFQNRYSLFIQYSYQSFKILTHVFHLFK